MVVRNLGLFTPLVPARSQLVNGPSWLLPQTLRSLECDGLITRTAVPTVPVTVTRE